MSRLSVLLSNRAFWPSIIRARASASASGVIQVRTKITESGILESPFTPVEIPDISLTDFIWSRIDKWEDKPCVTCGTSDRSYTFSEARAYSQRFGCAALGQLGLKKGDVLGLILPNIPEYVFAIYGGIEAGLIVTFANPLYTPDEILRQFENAEVRAIVTIQALLPSALHVGKSLKDYKGTIVIGQDEHEANTLSFKQLLMEAEPQDLPKLNPNDVALLPYSSGTTGLPKGVMLSHKNLVANLEQLMHPDMLDHKETTDTFQETILSVLPFFHIYGFNGILNIGLTHGIHLVSIPRFTPEDYLGAVLKYKPTMLFVVPSLLLFLASHPAVTKAHLESVTKVVCGAAPATKSLLDRFLEKVGRDNVNIRQGYGMTESSPVTLFPPSPDKSYGMTEMSPAATMPRRIMPGAKAGSCGQLIPNTQGVIKDLTTGKNLGPHQSGELWIKGPQVMVGYLKNKEATKETVDEDGWLHTGDVAYFDEDEYFFIVDRTKELIKVKGNQVSPTELENIIIQIPGVADVAVVGIPDTLSGEVPRAYVVLKQGSNIKEQEIIDYVSPKVTKYKKLVGGVCFLDAIPRNPAGKVLRQQLKVLGNPAK